MYLVVAEKTAAEGFDLLANSRDMISYAHNLLMSAANAGYFLP